MRIGLISDTHINEETQILLPEIMEDFKGVDLILHGGDIFIPSVLDQLQRIAPVLAASGDDDCGPVLRDERVKSSHIICLEGKTLWLTHGNPFNHPSKSRQAISYPELENLKNPDIVIFGHTHYSSIKYNNGIMFVNPGSPFNYSRKLGTIGILNLNPDHVSADILHLGEYGHSDYWTVPAQ